MEDDKNIEMVAVDERNSSKEGSVENGVVKAAQTDVSSEKGILDVCPIYAPIDHFKTYGAQICANECDRDLLTQLQL